MSMRILIYFVFLLLLTWIFYVYEVGYSYSDFKDYLSVLLTASSMVFTIMGIWIAFIYPNALRRLVHPSKIENVDFSETLSETKRLEGLVGSVLKSAFVVMVIMLLFLGKVIFYKSGLFLQNVDVIKSTLLSVVVLISLLQVESIFYVVYSNVMFINDIHTKREDREADNDV